MRLACSTLVVVTVLTSEGSLAQTPAAGPPIRIADKRETFGAGLAPPALPAGASAVYGFVGAPEIGGGYRQGVGGVELEARLTFNYFLVALILEGSLKLPVAKEGQFELAPTFGIGLVGNTGAKYLDRFNFDHFGLRVRAGVVGSMKVAETVRLLAAADVPFTLSINRQGGWHFGPLFGAGAEAYIGEDLSFFGLGQIGPDSIKEPQGVAQTRVGFAVKLGLGWRLF